MPAFVPLRYSLPIPGAVTNLLDAASLDALLDDVGLVSMDVSGGDSLLYRLDAVIAVREAVEFALPGLEGLALRLFAGLDPDQLHRFAVAGGWRRTRGVELEADLPLELRFALPGLRPAIVDADGPRPDPGRPAPTVLATARVRFDTEAGPSFDLPGGITMPPVLLGPSGFALEIRGVALRPAPFRLEVASGTLHFPRSLHPLARQVEAVGASLAASGFSGTLAWVPAAGSARVPLPGDLGDRLRLEVTGASLRFSDSALAAGRLVVGLADQEIPLPGIPGAALLLAAEQGLLVELAGAADGIGVTVQGVSASLRLGAGLLRPVDAAGLPDPSAQGVTLPLARPVLEVTPAGELVVDPGAHVVSIPRSLVGDTGVIVAADAVALHLDDAHPAPGRPAGWRGLSLRSASLLLPGELGRAVGELTLEDGQIGTDGFTGAVGPRWAPPLAVEVGGVSLALERGELRLEANALVQALLEGSVELPGAEGRVALRLAMDAGGVELRSVGELRLEGGVRLYPTPGAGGEPLPVLVARVDDGASAGLRFTLRGGIDVPRDGLDPVRVEVAGELELETTAAGVRVGALASGALAAELRLPGGVTAHAGSVTVAYDDASRRFTAALTTAVSLAEGVSVEGVAGAAELRARVVFDPTDPLDVLIDGTIANARLALAGQARVFDGELRVEVRTRPGAGEPPARVTLSGGTAALFPRDGASTGTPDDYYLAVEDLGASFTMLSGGFDLVVGEGRLRLPSEFFSADPAGTEAPAVGVGSPDHPLTLRYRAPDDLSFAGSVGFHDFSLRLPVPTGDEELVARLDTATLLFRGDERPLLTGVSGSLTVPLPDDTRAVVGFDDVAWDLDGLPTGEIGLREELALPLGGDFVLSLLPRETEPGGRVPGTRLRVTHTNGGGPRYTEFRFDAAVRLDVPESLLVGMSGGVVERVRAESSGWLAFSTAPGARPEVALSSIGVGGDFRLGGADGLVLRDARVDALGLEYLLDRGDPGRAFVLGLSGSVEFPHGGPTLGLENARFLFDGASLRDPPRFEAQGFRFTPGAWIADNVPLAVKDASIHFADGARTPEEMLDPLGLSIGLSLEVAVPMGEEAGLMGRVDGVRAGIDPDGLPRAEIAGIGFGVDGLTIGNTILTGIVYLGGLQGFPPDPRNLFCVGKLGGTMSGTGINALVGFKLDPPMPLGVCVDVSGGSGGIPLGQTGILLTGVRGGVSFANSNRSPCEFETYISYDADGTPRSLEEPPADGASPTVDEQVESSNPIAAPGCPCSCPPPSMNVFCQPHPDRDRYPERAIVKFSSIDEGMLRLLEVTLPDGRTLGLEELDAVRLESPAEFAALAGAIVRDGVVRYWPELLGELPPDAEAKLEAAQGELALRLDRVYREAGGSRSVWDVLRDEAYRGLPCPDVTMEVTATFSYSGVSAFLSVTGGCSLSTTGAAGVVGWLNVIGIPVGRLKGFLVATSDQGDIDPAICGELGFSVGPLELGKMNAQLDCRGLLTGVRDALAATAGEFGAPIVKEAMGALAPRVERWSDDFRNGVSSRALVVERKLLGRDYDALGAADALALLPELDGGQVTQLVDELLRLARTRATSDAERRRLESCAVALLQRLWDTFEPRLVVCGQVHPKIFGMPMGTALVDGTAWVTRRSVGAACAFSPLYLLAWGINAATATLCTVLAPLFAGLEQAILGFALELPDFAQLLLDGGGGKWRTTEELEEYLDDWAERLLANATLVAGYRLSPMGLTLVSSASRYLLPDLTDHPARPGRLPAWTRLPDAERIELLESILQLPGSPLSDASWNGRLDALGMPDRFLGRDFFPHGGLLGAARIVVPRALLDAPPLETFRLIASDEPVLTRFQAAMGYVKEYLLTTEETGTFAFYTPAPNPPTFAVDGRDLTAEELLRSITEPAYRERLLTGSYELGDPWSVDQSFMLGILQARLLGVPVVDGRMRFEPPGSNGASEGYLEVTAAIPHDSWLRRIADAELRFLVRQCPPLPMDVQLRALAAALGIPLDGPASAAATAEEAAGAALAAAPRSPEEAGALLARVRRAVESEAEAAVRAQLERGFPGSPVPASTVEAAMSDFRGRLDDQLAPLGRRLESLGAALASAAGAEEMLEALLAEIGTSLVRDLPRVALEVDARIQLPPALAAHVDVDAGAEARLYAYSPGYDPDATGVGARADAMRRGGIVASASLSVTVGDSGVVIPLPGGELNVVPPEPTGDGSIPLPRLFAEMAVADVEIPGTPVTLRAATLRVDSEPGDGPVLRVAASLDPVRVGGFGVEPREGDLLRGALQVLADGTTELRVEPARLTLPLLDGPVALRVHGDGPNDPFTLSTGGAWSASVTVEGGELVVRDPTGSMTGPLLRVRADGATARLAGEGLARVALSLSVPPGATVIAFPGQAMEQSWAATAELSLYVDGDGRVALEIGGVRPSFPGVLGDFLAGRGVASLHAYSPGFDPAAAGEGALARARREGGIVLAGEMDFRVGAGETHLAVPAGAVELAIVPAPLPDLPRLTATVSVGEAPLPFSALRMVDATLRFDSRPGRWEPWLRLSGGLGPIRVGAFGIEPREGESALRATLAVDREAVAELRIEPARLTLAGATALRLHGDAPDRPFTLASDGTLTAGVSLAGGDLALRVPFAPAPPLLELRAPAAALTATLRGTLGFAELELDVSGGATLSGFPGADFVQDWGASGSLGLLVNSDGRFALVVRGAAGFELPPALAGIVTLAGGAETRLVAYSPGYDPAAPGDTPLARVRREGGVALRTTLEVRLGPPGSPPQLRVRDAELAVLALPGDPPAAGSPPRLPRLVGVLSAHATLAEDPWLGLRIRSLTLDTAPDPGMPLLALAAEMPELHLGGFTLSPLAGAAPRRLRPVLAVDPDGEIRLELEPARLGHALLAGDTLLVLHGEAGETAPVRLSTTGDWSAAASVTDDILVQSPYDPGDPPLLRVEAQGVTATLSGTGLLPTRLSVAVPEDTRVTAFPGRGGPIEHELTHEGFSITANADGTFEASIDLSRLDFGALVIHGDDEETTGDDPHEPIHVSLSHYGFSIGESRVRLEPIHEPSLRLRRFVMDGRGDFQATATTRQLSIAHFFRLSSARIHVERASGVARVRLHSPRLGLRLPWAPRLAQIEDAGARLRLLPPGPEVTIDQNGVFRYEHPKRVRLGLDQVVRFEGVLEAGTRETASGVPEPYLRLTEVTGEIPALRGWSAPAPDLVDLKPTGFEARFESATLGIAGLAEVTGECVLGFDLGVGARFAMPSSRLTLFGEVGVPGPSVELTTDAAGGYELSFDAPSVSLAGGLLELGGTCTIRQTATQASLECTATFRGLPPLGVRFSAEADGILASFEAPVGLLDLGGLLKLDLLANSLLLRPAPGGGFDVEAHLGATLLGEAREFRVGVHADGTVVCPWPAPFTLPLGPFAPVSHDTSITANLFRPDRALELRLFGLAATAERLPNDGYRLVCESDRALPVLPALLALGPATWTLERVGSGTTVSFDGQARALQRPAGTWVAEGSAAFTLRGPANTFTATISASDEIAVSALAGRLAVRVPAGAFHFGRGADGTLSVGAAVEIVLFGETLELDASIASGKATAGWSDGRFPLGPVTLVPEGRSTVEIDPRTPSPAGCRLSLAGGSIEFPAGWGLSPMSYDPRVLSGDTLSVGLSRDADEAGWHGVPGRAAELQAASPSLRVQLEGAVVAVYFEAGPLRVRTTATVDGRPWGTGELGSISHEVSAGGEVGLSLPGLTDARAACRNRAHATADAARAASSGAVADAAIDAALEADLALCDEMPDPPAMPDLSGVFGLNVGSLLGPWS